MSTTASRIPFFIKVAITIITGYVVILMLVASRNVLLPILFAMITAIAISPAVNYFIRKNFSRALAILIVMMSLLMVTLSFFALLISQASLLTDAMPILTLKLDILLTQSIDWASDCFSISTEKINTWLTHSKTEIIAKSGTAVGDSLTAVGEIITATLLTLVYIFMLLFYQSHLVKFLHKIFGATHNVHLSEVLTETKSIIQRYLAGMFIEFTIVAALNIIGLTILGIDYAIILGLLATLVNVIPYIGGIIGVLLFMIIALITKSPVYVIYVAGLYTIIQFIDNHFIIPKVIGAKVKLNALISLLAVISGAALWGIPGMFLSIPMMAIIKLICDRIDALKPIGFLLGVTLSAGDHVKFGDKFKLLILRIKSKK